ncbi:MAG: hypothetical protein AAGJ52_05055 [Pseudomonadota bacterium]
MMSSPAMYWVQQITAAPLIAALILLLSLIPARHVLLPLWPSAAQELILVLDETDGERPVARRLFVYDDPIDGLSGEVLARTEPLSLARIESRNGDSLLGYPVALRSAIEDGETRDEPLSAAFDSGWLEPMPGETGQLALLGPDDQVLTLPMESIQRLYYPNRLGLIDRTLLLLRRSTSCWAGACVPNAQSSHSAVISDE